MIIRKLWVTEKKTKYISWTVDGRGYNHRERHWEGLFLFGFIPLYIDNTKNLYDYKFR